MVPVRANLYLFQKILDSAKDSLTTEEINSIFSLATGIDGNTA
jgi:hypothetical protein